VKRVLFTPVVRATNASTAGSLALTARSDNVTPADATDDFLLEGATVRIRAGDGTVVATQGTAADGTALISLPPGTYDVEIEAAGHTSATLTDVPVVLANLTDVGSVVLVAAGEIGGVVMSDGATAGDTLDDVVVAGATVELRAAGETGVPLATTETDGSGAWRFEALAAGTYDLAVVAEGFVPGALPGVAAELETPGYAILLEALTQDLAGTVTVPEDADPTAISIVALNRAGVIAATTSPAADGTYTVALATGDYEIVFDDGDAGAPPQTFDVTMVGATPPQTLDVTFE
jgi:hypothetical protein